MDSRVLDNRLLEDHLLGWLSEGLLLWHNDDSLLLMLLLSPAAAPGVFLDAGDGLDGFLGSLELLDPPEVGTEDQGTNELDQLAASLASCTMVFLVRSSVVWLWSIELVEFHGDLVSTLVELFGDVALDWGASNNNHVGIILVGLDLWSSVVSVMLATVLTSSAMVASLVVSAPSSEHTSLLWLLVLILWRWWWSSMVTSVASEAVHEALEDRLFSHLWLFSIKVGALEDSSWK